MILTMSEKVESNATSDSGPKKCNDYLESCRVCMAKHFDMKPLFDTQIKNSVVDQIQFCTGLEISFEDGLPTGICTLCLSKLSIAYNFKTTCILSDEAFRKLTLQTIIKCEPDAEFTLDDGVCENDEIDETIVKNEEKFDETELEYKKERKSKRIQMNKEVIRLDSNPKVSKRGPYKKSSGKPKRIRKFKFRKLCCETCDIKFTSKTDFDEHKKEMHKDPESWMCEICGKVFQHRGSHYTHLKSHLPPSYACEQCDYRTWHRHDLIKHTRIHTGIKQYQCEFCTKSYYNSSNLTSHIKRQHQRLRPHRCGLCERSFFDRAKLNRHVDSHNEIRRYECEVCHSSFTRRCYWKKHLEKQHSVHVPPQRPGRQRLNYMYGDCLVNSVDNVAPA